MKRAATVLLWILSAFVALVMVGSGAEKFLKPAWERMFRVWGYPDHFYAVVGIVEIVAGVGLLVPRLASVSALSLAVVMIGAAYTQMTHRGSGFGELMLLTFLCIVAYGRRPAVRLKPDTTDRQATDRPAAPAIGR